MGTDSAEPSSVAGGGRGARDARVEMAFAPPTFCRLPGLLPMSGRIGSPERSHVGHNRCGHFPGKGCGMMLLQRSALTMLVFVAGLLTAAPSMAQGPFSWQLSPFCNVVTLTANPQGPVFNVSGLDDNCGGPARSGASGTAFFNPDGSIGVSLAILASTGVPRNIAVRLNAMTLSGSWSDSSGNSGTFNFNPPSPASGSPLPAPMLPTGPPGPQGPTGRSVLSVVDGTGTQVGNVDSVDIQLVRVILQVNGSPYSVRVSRDAFIGDGAVVFTSSDCLGQAFIRFTIGEALLPRAAVVSGFTVLVANLSAGLSTVIARSERLPDGSCLAIPVSVQVQEMLAPALLPIDLSTRFTPPFRIQLNTQQQ